MFCGALEPAEVIDAALFVLLKVCLGRVPPNEAVLILLALLALTRVFLNSLPSLATLAYSSSRLATALVAASASVRRWEPESVLAHRIF